MQITLTLAQEETDALNERVDLYNTGSGQPPLTAEQFMERVHCQEFIARLVDERYQRSLTRLGTMFKNKPYEERIATIAQLEGTV